MKDKDMRFRLCLLEALYDRPAFFFGLYREVFEFYYGLFMRELHRSHLYAVLNRFSVHGLVVKKKVLWEGEGSRIKYFLTEKGRKKMEYYQRILRIK